MLKLIIKQCSSRELVQNRYTKVTRGYEARFLPACEFNNFYF
jgi:hypothetical protein